MIDFNRYYFYFYSSYGSRILVRIKVGNYDNYIVDISKEGISIAELSYEFIRALGVDDINSTIRIMGVDEYL